MSLYKVKLGEKTVEVDGLGGLLKLAQAGELKPDDPVYVPSTARWHYARSIRQLRDHFVEDRAPPPPPRAPAAPRIPSPAVPPERNVVPLRRGTWSPEGRGVEIPVFAYDVDLEAPPVYRNLRLIVLSGGGLLLVFLFWVYLSGYHRYLADAFPDGGIHAPAPVPSRTPIPSPRKIPATARALAPTPVPSQKQPQVIAPLYDAATTLAQVRALKATPAARPDQLGTAMRSDLIKLTVPVHAVAVTAMKSTRDRAVPFKIVVDYAPGSIAAASRAKHRFEIVAYLGRRIGEIPLNAGTIEIHEAQKGKAAMSKTVPVDLAKRVAAGSAEAAEVDALFRR